MGLKVAITPAQESEVLSVPPDPALPVAPTIFSNA